MTVTIGGNDLNYVGNLFNAACAHAQRHRRASKTAAGQNKVKACNPVRIPTEADYQRDEMQLDRIAWRVRELAPDARLVFVQYLQPLPAAGKLCADTPISEDDARRIRKIGTRLSQIIDRVGRENGALVVEMDKSSATHTPCDADPWMIGDPPGYDGHDGLQWHLNLTGMQATAQGISYWLAKIPDPDTAPEQEQDNASPAQSPASEASRTSASTVPDGA